MSIEKIKLTALILNWNSASDSIELYHLLKQYIDTNNIELSVLVIDNDSQKPDQEKLKANIETNALIFTGKNLGYAGGNNVGVRKALDGGADFVIVLNPDIRIDSDFLSPLVAILKSNPEIAVIGPRICFKDNPALIYSDGGILDIDACYKTGHHNWKMLEKDVDSSLREVAYVNGSVMLVPRQTFLEFGFFREDFFMYFEETEWCLRLKKANKKVMVAPSVKVYHESSNKGKNYHFYMSRNRLWLAKVNGVNYAKTRNKYLKMNLLNLLKRKPFSLSKLKGTIHGALFSPHNF